MTKDDVLTALHEIAGHCGHCGKRSCPGRASHSTLPDTLSTDDVFTALKSAKRLAKRRRECSLINEQIQPKTADAGMGSGSDEGAAATPVAGEGAATADHRPAAAPDELCDIDDLPDCLVGGVHQDHRRHAGKPVGPGGNP